jgi:hypothetical protein
MAATVSVGTKIWADKINGAWRRSAASVIEAGQILLNCKAAVRPGDFQRMVKGELDFGASMARKFMAIAGDQRLIERSHENAPMPKHWTTLYELHLLDDAALEGVLSNGKTRRADVQKLRPPAYQTIPFTDEDIPPTITDAQYTEERSPAATALVVGDAAVLAVEADPIPVSTSLDNAADDLSRGTEVADTREGEDEIAGVTDHEEDEGPTPALIAGIDFLKKMALPLQPPGCPPDMVAYYVKPGDPMSGFANGLAMMMASVKEFIADDGTQEGVARDFPSDHAMYPDDLTKFVDWMVDFDAEWRELHPHGNEVAMGETEE